MFATVTKADEIALLDQFISTLPAGYMCEILAKLRPEIKQQIDSDLCFVWSDLSSHLQELSEQLQRQRETKERLTREIDSLRRAIDSMASALRDLEASKIG